MEIRHSHQIICNPAIAKHIAEWNILTAAKEKESPHYLLISAMVFLAFMLDGVVNHLGELYIEEWNIRKNGKRGKGWLPFKDRHKLVKTALGGVVTPPELNNTIKALFDFRDSFAHPKKQSHVKKEHGDSFKNLPLPPVGWQTLTYEKTEEVFFQINDYCNALLALDRGLGQIRARSKIDADSRSPSNWTVESLFNAISLKQLKKSYEWSQQSLPY